MAALEGCSLEVDRRSVDDCLRAVFPVDLVARVLRVVVLFLLYRVNQVPRWGLAEGQKRDLRCCPASVAGLSAMTPMRLWIDGRVHLLWKSSIGGDGG